ncbi:MAG: SH3 domain-containing protein [Proteobacteria bacterium]|nr:SH3 domain-containing protein [Pseudomonadota bacterium]MBU1714435.1 SH3 domain-containing protein [Pseudomonadota bacterium]
MNMPRTSRNCLVTVLISLLILTLTSSPAFSAEYFSIKNDGVNIRSGPSTTAEILWELFKDFPVKVLQKKGDWSQIQDFEGDTGWIYSPLLSSEKTAIVNTQKAYMRIGPGENYEPLATVKYGVVFTMIGKEGEWTQLLHNDGTSGWMHESLLWPKY